MMNITLKSKVEEELGSVYSRFDKDLFSYLLPPGARLISFGGCETGDLVHLKLPVAGEWISEVTEHSLSESKCYFIDEGRKLPFPLKKWKHEHVFRSFGKHTIIEDRMSFSTGSLVTDTLFYPVLLASFLPRLWQYRNYFKLPPDNKKR